MITDRLAAEKKTEQQLIEKLKDDEPIDVTLASGSHIYLERPMPYLTYCRIGEKNAKSVTAAFLKSQPVYIWNIEEDKQVEEFLTEALPILYKRFGAFLFFELDETEGEKAVIEYADFANKPAFVNKLERALQHWFTVDCQKISEKQAKEAVPDFLSERAGEQYVRLCLPRKAYQQKNGHLYPMRFRKIHHALDTALRKAFFDFVRLQTRQATSHYHAMGRQQPGTLVWEIDQKLAEISQNFDFLLLTSVLNHVEGWEEFKKHNYQQKPSFRYRLIPLDPDLVKRDLYNLPIEEVEDPTLSYILRDKRTELDKMLNMLIERNTDHFKLSSVQVFGDIEGWLLQEAEDILKRFPDPDGPSAEEDMIDADAFAAMGREEIAYLKQQYELVDAKVEIRKDISGLMVSQGQLLVGDTYKTSRKRAEALLQHEVGTHVLTYYNGKAQPLQIFKTGTPGYEDLQEGLAVLAEYFSGGLTGGRLRTLAARVVAVDCMLRDHSFPQCFALLHEEYNFSARSAYNITERIFRGGGNTKDAVYLRGLICLLNHLEQGDDLGSLLIGKIQQSYFPFVQELLERKILVKPPLLPRYMERSDYQDKLNFLRTKTKVADLVSGE